MGGSLQKQANKQDRQSYDDLGNCLSVAGTGLWLGSADQKLLDGLAKAYKKNPSFLTKSLQMKQGTRLRRLWNGKVYEVTAEREGFSYDGKRYRSLSEIARLITNTRWNGRVFFGLKSAPKTGKTAGGADVQASA